MHLLGSDEEVDFGEEGDAVSYAGSGSPSKLTARQRAKGNKDLQETLIALPNGESWQTGATSGQAEWSRELLVGRARREQGARGS